MTLNVRSRLKGLLEGPCLERGLNLTVALVERLPPALASSLGGALGRWLGPWLPSTKIARINLALAFPGLSKKRRDRIVRDCWDNIGRTLAEFPHISRLPPMGPSGPGWRIEGRDHLLEARLEAQRSGRPVIFFSGHLGNWELMPPLVDRYGLPFAPFYRAPNNPAADRILRRLRERNNGRQPLFPKGARGARGAVRHLAAGKHLGILGDQKMNDGIASRLFGLPAMTAPAAAVLALRFNAVIVTGHVWREGPARLVLEVDPLIEPSAFALNALNRNAQSRQAAIAELTQYLNDRLQSWIERRPGNWLWLHRRWDKKLYKKPLSRK